MPATGNTQAGTNRPPSATDVGAVAREAVVSFLRDASNATAERASQAEGTASPGTAESVAVHAAARSVAALDRIEAAAAKVEADIAAALRAYAELQAGAGAAAQAAVDAAQSALASAGVAVEAERQVKISLRQVRQYVVVTTVLLAVVIIVLALVTTNVH
jgi:hypothetical protein